MTYLKHLIVLLALPLSAVSPAAGQSAVFDFADPASLTPSLPVPEVKSSIGLDGNTFTCGNITITFEASESGNTHVRLFHSYDAGCDLRLYDGDAMTVATKEPADAIARIEFTGSLSGAATGSSDINLIPSSGSFVWADECWLSGSEPTGRVTLVSDRQSRMTRIEVYLAAEAGVVAGYAMPPASAEYFTITGRRLSGQPSLPGIYLVRQDAVTRKIIISR